VGAGVAQPPGVRRSQAGAARPRTTASARDAVVGIDFGSTSCRVGLMDGDEPRILRDEAGRSSIPAVAWFGGPEASAAGHDAWERTPLEPVRTIAGVRRLLGCRAVDRDAAQYLRAVACPARARAAGGVAFRLGDLELTPVDVAATILRHARESAERALGRPVTRAVLSHPLTFDEEGLADLEQAARLAGLDPMALVPEPAAVALAYGFGGKTGVVGVYDFGGGSFSFTVLECGGVPAVLGAASDPWLGGDEMDVAVARAGAEEFFRVTQVDLRQRVVEWRRVVQAAEEAKVLLSSSGAVELSVPRAALTSQGEVDLCLPLTRPRFDELTGDLVYNSLRVSQRAFAEAGVSKDRLEALLLAGGVSRVPAVRAMAKALYGREPHAAAYPERAAALGATLVAADMTGRPAPLGPCAALVAEERVGSTIGLAMAGGVTEPLIARGTPVPTALRRVFATFRDGQTRLEVRIVTGEDRQTAGNRVIGAVEVIDLPAGPAGSAEVEIKFEMSSVDVLGVRTHDLASGRRRWTHFPIPR
jgi:molecular chaperone DnaK